MNALVQKLEQDADTLQLETGALRQQKLELEASRKALQKALEQFWLGHYEYYEVRDGDTLPSIAGQAAFYGDPDKAIWIEQANFSHVKDLERLRPGEVLIIPRFPPSGRYEF